MHFTVSLVFSNLILWIVNLRLYTFCEKIAFYVSMPCNAEAWFTDILHHWKADILYKFGFWQVILFPAMFRCITLMPMKGEILVDTMEKTLKPGVFLKSGLIETEGLLEVVKGHL